MQATPQQFRNAGLYAFNRGEYTVAARCVEAAIQGGLNDPELWNLLAATQVLMGHLNHARWSFRKAIDLNPKLAHLHANYGRLLLRTEEWRSAARAFSRASELAPDIISYRSGEAYAWLKEGKAQTAVSLLEAYLSPAHPERHEHLLMIEAQMKAGNRAAARRWLEQTAARNEYPQLQLAYASLLIEADEAADAIQILEELSATRRQRYLLGLACLLTEQLDALHRYLTEAGSPLSTADQELLLAWQAQAQGDHELALARWKALEQQHPDSLSVKWGLSVLMEECGDPQYETVLEKILNQDPDHAKAMWALVQAWKNKPERAKTRWQLLDKLILSRGRWAAPRIERGFLLLEKGLPEQALLDFQQAKHHGEEEADLLLGLGLAFAACGKPTEAEAPFRTLTTRYPEVPQVWWNLALLLIGQQQWRKALEAIRQVSVLQSETPEALKLEGEILFNLGQTQAAGERWRKAKELQK